MSDKAYNQLQVSTHSRPKAAGYNMHGAGSGWVGVSTHSRPKAAGAQSGDQQNTSQFQHTAARRRLGQIWNNFFIYFRFQHTAARRRLELSRDSD